MEEPHHQLLKSGQVLVQLLQLRAVAMQEVLAHNHMEEPVYEHARKQGCGENCVSCMSSQVVYTACANVPPHMLDISMGSDKGLLARTCLTLVHIVHETMNCDLKSSQG